MDYLIYASLTSCIISVICSILYFIPNYYVGKMEKDDGRSSLKFFILLTFIPILNLFYLRKMLKSDFIKDIYTIHYAFLLSQEIDQKFKEALDREEHVMNTLVSGEPNIILTITFKDYWLLELEELEDRLSQFVYHKYDGHIVRFDESQKIMFELKLKED